MYLNYCICNKCNEILNGLNSCDFDKVIAAKETAKRVVDEQEIEFNGSNELKMWHNHCMTSSSNTKNHVFSSSKYSFFEKLSGTGIGVVIQSSLIALGGFALIAGIIYLIYQVWWFFVGEWALEGPFRSEYSTFDITAETVIYFIAFVVIIEEAIRRIRNGHF